MSKLARCRWVPKNNPAYQKYHDEEWGVPIRDDGRLFEMLLLEGAQAGLSWETILKKRSGYRRAFHSFDAEWVAKMTDGELEALHTDPAIVRNRRKIFAARQNAKIFIKIQREFGSFATYLWAHIDNAPIVPTTNDTSDRIAKDLRLV
jgi:DNA-3-methyladenine glycosylase I